jgi:hypothetical protein
MPRPNSEDLGLRVWRMLLKVVKTTCKVSAFFQVSPGFISKCIDYGSTGGAKISRQGYRDALRVTYAEALEQLRNIR